MTQRKWLAECHAWLDDPTSVQYFHSGMQTWDKVVDPTQFNPLKNPDYKWRIKPATITINGCELPKPVPQTPDSEAEWRLTIGASVDMKHFYFNTREDRDAVYAKLVEVLGS